jgi:PQ loop repeat
MLLVCRLLPHNDAGVQIVVALILGLGARCPQIVLNFKRGHTGTLAPQTSIFNAMSNIVNGTVATVLTTDPYVIGTQVWMFSLNMTILIQILSSRRAMRSKQADQKNVQRYSYADEFVQGGNHAQPQRC